MKKMIYGIFSIFIILQMIYSHAQDNSSFAEEKLVEIIVAKQKKTNGIDFLRGQLLEGVLKHIAETYKESKVLFVIPTRHTNGSLVSDEDRIYVLKEVNRLFSKHATLYSINDFYDASYSKYLNPNHTIKMEIVQHLHLYSKGYWLKFKGCTYNLYGCFYLKSSNSTAFLCDQRSLFTSIGKLRIR